MLTMLRIFRPKMRIDYYGVLVDWCLVKSDYYRDKDIRKSAYWTKLAGKYLLKRVKAVNELL